MREAFEQKSADEVSLEYVTLVLVERKLSFVVKQVHSSLVHHAGVQKAADYHSHLTQLAVQKDPGYRAVSELWSALV